MTNDKFEKQGTEISTHTDTHIYIIEGTIKTSTNIAN